MLEQCSMGAMMVFRQALGGRSGYGEIRPDFSQDHWSGCRSAWAWRERNTSRQAAAVCDCWLLRNVPAAAAHDYCAQDEAFVLFSVKYSHVERLAVLRRWAGGGDLLQAQRRSARLLSCCRSCIVFCIVKPRGGTLSPQLPTLVYWLSVAARACCLCLLTCFIEAT